MGHLTCKIVPTTGIIGAIAGDCFGAAYEFHPVKHGDFDIYKEPRFTDDTVMTLAVAKWLTSVPESIISYLEADSYTSAIRNAISLGGDADTMACMAGGIVFSMLLCSITRCRNSTQCIDKNI